MCTICWKLEIPFVFAGRIDFEHNTNLDSRGKVKKFSALEIFFVAN